MEKTWDRICFWSAAFRSTRVEEVFRDVRRAARRGARRPCPTARSGRAGTGSAASTIRCCPAIRSLKTVQRPKPENGVERLNPAQCRRQLAVQGQGRRRPRAVRRSGLAARLCARRDQLVLRVQDAAREGRAARSTCASRCRCLGEQRAAAADFSRSRRRREGAAGLHRRRSPPRSAPSSRKSRTTISPSSGIARPRCRTPTARCRARPAMARSSATSRSSARCRQRIPDKVELGYHFCFGTLGGWPRFAPADLSATVRLANATVEASGRRVDWIHIPVLTDARSLLRAAEGSASRTARGSISASSITWTASRSASRTARKYLPEFGVGGLLRLRPLAAGRDAGGARRAPASHQVAG